MNEQFELFMKYGWRQTRGVQIEMYERLLRKCLDSWIRRLYKWKYT
jgi:hypothetical protein